MGHTFIHCINCNKPLMVASLFADGVFLIAGAKCATCGEGHVYEDNDFKYDDLKFRVQELADNEHH